MGSLNASDNNSILNALDPDLNLLDDALPSEMCKYETLESFNLYDRNENQFSILNYNICSFHAHSPSFPF